jgi:hypothetical protein
MSSEQEKDDLIRDYEGNFDRIPGKEKKEVRIFLSSTFTGRIFLGILILNENYFKLF